MPTFGEFETVGEPFSVTRESGHVSRVWQARLTGGKDERAYAIKVYAPKPRSAAGNRAAPGLEFLQDERGQQSLERDRGLEFLEGVKQLEETRAAGGPGAASLARIYGFDKTGENAEAGLTHEGAWYATEFCPGKTLKEFIQVRGKVDSAALRHAVRSVLAGCVALQRTRNCGHGNLKPSNVLLGAQNKPLSKRPLWLIDAYPAAPSQLDRLGSRDQKEAAGLIRQVIEARDLRNLGELILQLVEGRLIGSGGYDFDYPVQSSPAWARLGKDSKDWLDLCNSLLNPSLSLDEVNFEKLSAELGNGENLWSNVAKLTGSIGTGSTGPVMKKVALVAGCALALLGLAAALWKIWIHRENVKLETATQWANAISDGRKFLESTNFSDAAESFKVAKSKAQALSDSSKEHEATDLLSLASDLHDVQQEYQKPESVNRDHALILKKLAEHSSAKESGTWRGSVWSDAAKKAKTQAATMTNQAYAALDTATNQNGLTSARTRFEAVRDYAAPLNGLLQESSDYSIQASNGLHLVGKLEESLTTERANKVRSLELARLVLHDRPGNALANTIKGRIESKELPADDQKRLADTVKAVQANWAAFGMPEKLALAVTNDFLNDLHIGDVFYSPPAVWVLMDKTNRDLELNRLETMLSSLPNGTNYDGWSRAVSARYAPFRIPIQDWPPPMKTLSDGVDALIRGNPTNAALQLLRTKVATLSTRVVSLNETTNGGPATNDLVSQANKLLVDYRAYEKERINLSRDIKAGSRSAALSAAREAFTSGLGTGDFREVRNLCANYPKDAEFTKLLQDVESKEGELPLTVTNLTNIWLGENPALVFTNALFTKNPSVLAIYEQVKELTNVLASSTRLAETCDFKGASNAIGNAEQKSLARRNQLVQIQAEKEKNEALRAFADTQQWIAASNYFQTNLSSTLQQRDCFTNHYSRAVRALAVDGALASAQKDFNAGDYTNAFQACANYPDDPRSRELTAKINKRYVALGQAEPLLKEGQYTNLFAALAKYDFTNEGPFRLIRSNAETELATLKRLQGLETETSRPVLMRELDELQRTNLTLRGKEPFQDVAKWVAAHDPAKAREKDLKEIEDQAKALEPGEDQVQCRKRLAQLRQKYTDDDATKRLRSVERVLNGKIKS